MDDAGHIPVLAAHVLDLLSPQPGQICLDCTLGRGGHARLIAQRLGDTGHLIGLDVDPDNLAFAQSRLADMTAKITCTRASFIAARALLDGLDIPRVDLLLADLGFSSTQMDDPARGFSFQQHGPLDMRLDPDQPQSAADLVNRLPESELADLIYQYGEERHSRRIARKIAEVRKQAPINTTTELAEIVRRAATRPGRGGRARSGGSRTRIDPATRTFMALRIAVNRELEALDALLEQLPRLLAPSGKAAIISFHSLEDRKVKQAFVEMERHGLGHRLTRKPLTASEDEQRLNPRSRSAKLRAFEFESSPELC